MLKNKGMVIKMKINVVKLREGARLPFKATEGSAGADLFACIEEPKTIKAGEILFVPTGIAMEIPVGYGGFMFPRSSLACRYGISFPNCVGVIDSDYRGEISAVLINQGKNDYTVNPGDRVAQMVIMPVESAEYMFAEGISDTGRGKGGFGSTGKN